MDEEPAWELVSCVYGCHLSYLCMRCGLSEPITSESDEEIQRIIDTHECYYTERD